MKDKLFSNSVYNNLKESNSFSLKLLLEEEEDKGKKKEEDPFAALDKPEDLDEPESDEPKSNEPDLDKPDSDATTTDLTDDEDAVTKEQFDNLLDQMEKISTYVLGVRDEEGDGTQDGVGSLEAYISAGVEAGLNESIKRSFAAEKIINDISLIKEKYNNTLKNFLLKEDDKDKLAAVEAEIDDLDRILTKGTEVVDKFKKGRELNIEKYVNVALNAFRNFDSLFSKESIVKQATINVLVLNSGAKADQNIAEFKKRFHEELSRQFGIEYEDEVLDVDRKNTAAGAKSQG
tara:strand:- start:64 stop:933 length:870 start_codon:yes stop_codon:yes gene_type:complete